MKKLLPFAFLLGVLGPTSVAGQENPTDRYESLRQTTDAFDRSSQAGEPSPATAEFRSRCMAVVATAPFCRCLADNLPRGLSFDQYVVVVTRSKEENAYDKMSAAQRRTYDAIPGVRDACANAPGGAASEN